MEAFLESTQRFGFDFNYQSTSSVEKRKGQTFLRFT